ncbi:hypothetical protein [Streptomyces sp. ISL-12]|uniref:hypothetical protein n=1 Tax=Streptomyces sp. ISL-12 TaxID=2819177 RepID=UPI0027E02216|nr:hypothetical protein [Streptomyces sp. ISL-12]
MQRTTTTATLLVTATITAAVTAVTGCVTVQRPPAPGTAAGEARPSAPRPDGSRRPPPVEAPARESLESTGPSSQPDEPDRADETGAAEGREETNGQREPDGPRSRKSDAARGPAPSAAPPRRPPPATPPKARPRPARPPRSAPALPEVPPAAPGQRGEGADVCALGRTYGRWQPDSPEASICRQTYGH